MLIFWAFSSLVIQMFKRMRSVTWVVFVIYTYREKSHTRGAELVDWQAALKHPCWARFMCFIPTRCILIEFFLTLTQLPQTFSFLLFIFSCQHPLQYTSKFKALLKNWTYEMPVFALDIRSQDSYSKAQDLSFTLFICKTSFVQTPQGLRVVESRFYTAPCDNVLVFNDSLNGGALVWLSKVKIRLPRPKQPGLLWINH